MKKLGPFDIIKSINEGPKSADLLNGVKAYEDSSELESAEKAYVPFVINRALSYFPDTVMLASVMNEYPELPARMQYDFLRNAVRPRRRFSKWFKAIKDDDDIKLIMTHYNYSSDKARAVRDLFSDEAMIELRNLHDKGGRGS